MHKTSLKNRRLHRKEIIIIVSCWWKIYRMKFSQTFNVFVIVFSTNYIRFELFIECFYKELCTPKKGSRLCSPFTCDKAR